MEEYHIGKEIEKEVRKQYPNVNAFARALNRERQTVYDIFKRSHIATDRLMEVSRLLNRDFFKELSDICTKGAAVVEEDETTIKERIGLLMPEDELHVVEESQVADVADEYFSSPRQKPLLMFFDNGTNLAYKTFINVGESILGAGMIKNISVKKDEVAELECQIQDLAALPQKAIELWFIGGVGHYGYGCDKIIQIAEKLIAESGKFVFIFNKSFNGMDKGYDVSNRNSIVYHDGVERCFNIWHNRAHIFVADNNNGDFARNQRLYGSYKLYRLLNEIINKTYCGEYVKFDLLGKKLSGKHTFSVKCEDVSEEKSRCIITETEMKPCDRELYSECRSITPYKEVIFDISKDNGDIVDYECKEYKRGN